jgi:hypothetical protein
VKTSLFSFWNTEVLQRGSVDHACEIDYQELTAKIDWIRILIVGVADNF